MSFSFLCQLRLTAKRQTAIAYKQFQFHHIRYRSRLASFNRATYGKKESLTLRLDHFPLLTAQMGDAFLISNWRCTIIVTSRCDNLDHRYRQSDRRQRDQQRREVKYVRVEADERRKDVNRQCESLLSLHLVSIVTYRSFTMFYVCFFVFGYFILVSSLK